MSRTAGIRSRALQSRDAIELLSSKWRIAVLHLLTAGPLRTGELQRALEDISPKVLTQTVRGMKRDGLIARRVAGGAPPRIDYELTQMGPSVVKPVKDLCHWARAHVTERDAARRRYDAAVPSRSSAS